MARRKVEVRREEILAATVERVTVQGFDQVRVADVAAALGISPALVFYHFATKDRLLAAALEHAADQNLARLERAGRGAPGAVARLRRVLRLYAPGSGAPGWPLWIDAWAAGQRSPELQATLRRLDERWREAFVAVIREGVAEGVFTCPDPEAAARRLMAVMDGLAVQATVHREVRLRQMAQWSRVAAAHELGLDPAVLDVGGRG